MYVQRTGRKEKALDAIAVNHKNGIRLSARELATLVTSTQKAEMRMTQVASVGDAYVKMICDYVNTVRNAEIPAPERKLSCAMLTSGHFEDMIKGRRPPDTREAHIGNALGGLGVKALQDFMALDFFFVPHVVNEAHSILLGIAPKQRFVFVIDSGKETYDERHQLVKGLIYILHFLNPDYRYAKDNKQPNPGDWRIYGEWSHRSQTTDDSPDAAQQSDDYNCGIFTCTSAFCLAFGFRLTCFTGNDLDPFKKPRMAAEFANGGLSGPGFNYDMLDLPVIKGQSGVVPPLPPPVQAPTESIPASRANTDKKPPPRKPERTGSRLMRWLSKRAREKRDDDNDDDDDDEQGGFRAETEVHDVETGDRSASGDSGSEGSSSEGSDGESDEEDSLAFKKEPLYTPSQLAYILNLTPATSNNPKKDNVPFPAQFDRAVHQQAGFIYGVPEGLNLQDRKYSKRELKQACRDFGVVGWKDWSFERQGFFMKFVMSELGAIMAQRKGDEVQPFPGIGEVPGLETSFGAGNNADKRRKVKGNEREGRPSRVQPRRSVKKRRVLS